MSKQMHQASSSTSASKSLVKFYDGWRLLASLSKTIHALVDVIFRTLWQPARLFLKKELPKLSSLPLELIEVVLLELEWNDVLRARVTCRSMYDASKSLALWSKLFRQLSDSYTIPIIPPKPFEAYTAQELEKLVMRWLRADSLWSPSVPRDPPAFRNVRQTSPMASVVLVEGGRWLLTTDDCDKGCIYSHLLGSETTSEMTSTTLYQTPNETTVTSMHANVDHSSPNLAFDLVVVCENRKGAAAPGRVGIWRVTETADAALSCSQTTSFTTPIPNNINFRTLSLGSLFARFDGFKLIEVYDWSRSRNDTHCKCVIRASCRGNSIVDMRLLPGRKMLMIGHQTLSVISIPAFATYTNCQMPTPHQSPPLFHWKADGYMVRDAISTAACHGHDTYVTVATSQGIYLIHILQNEVLLKLLLQIKLSPSVPFPLGTHRAMMNRGPGENLAALSLNHKEATVKRYCTNRRLEAYGPQPTIDEWSGRAVFYLPDGWVSVVEG